jgi:hypothetical protein
VSYDAHASLLLELPSSAATFSVAVDFCAAAEIGTGAGCATAAPIGILSSFAANAAHGGEIAAALRGDMLLPAEIGAAIRSDRAPVFEALKLHCLDGAVAAEQLAVLRRDVGSVLVEVLTAARLDAGVPLEFTARLFCDADVALENLGALVATSDRVVNIETLAQMLAAGAAAGETLAGTAAASLAAAEHGLALRPEAPGAIGILLAARVDAAPGAENVGALVITGDRLAAIEWLAAARFDAAARAEQLGSGAAAAVATGEAVLAACGGVSGGLESIVAVAVGSREALDFTLAFANETAAAAELLQIVAPFSADGMVALEIGAAVGSPAAAAIAVLAVPVHARRRFVGLASGATFVGIARN